MKLYVTGLAALLLSTTAATAQTIANEVRDVGTVFITGNTDNSGDDEGVRILSNSNADNVNGAYINVIGDDVSGSNVAGITMSGDTRILNGNVRVGQNGNTTSLLSDQIFIGTGNYNSMVEIGSMDAASVISRASDAQVVLGREGEERWVADANGKLIQNVGGQGDVAGDTAAILVTNLDNNTHGLVVENTRTTLSGGQTAASSLTLSDNGATFSNSTNGAPIQVHGVADGTAPFDAVNVRQLYGGLAAVLASAPEIRLEPGQTGIGIGLGSYGGYTGFGLGLGYMSENGMVATASISQAESSRTAIRASLSYAW